MGEELYSRINKLREQMLEVSETVDETAERVTAIENKLDGQTAMLEALAEQQGVDVDEVLTDVAIEEAEATDEDTPDEAIPDAESNEDGATSDSA